jgi:hypothetical protein
MAQLTRPRSNRETLEREGQRGAKDTQCARSRRIILEVILGGCVLSMRETLCSVLALGLSAFPVAAQFKSSPSVAPPVMAAPPKAVTVPNTSIPSAAPPSAASVAPPAAVSAPSAPSAGPSQQVPTCRRPDDCREDFNEEARRKFAECVEKLNAPRTVDWEEALEDCAFGFMSPSKFAAYKQCMSEAPFAWQCFKEAYH